MNPEIIGKMDNLSGKTCRQLGQLARWPGARYSQPWSSGTPARTSRVFGQRLIASPRVPCVLGKTVSGLKTKNFRPSKYSFTRRDQVKLGQRAYPFKNLRGGHGNCESKRQCAK